MRTVTTRRESDNAVGVLHRSLFGPVANRCTPKPRSRCNRLGENAIAIVVRQPTMPAQRRAESALGPASNNTAGFLERCRAVALTGNLEELFVRRA